MFTPQNFGFESHHVQPRDQKTGQQVYFDGNKKNQLNDLKKYLKTIVSDPQKEFYRKEVIKKIISFTTAGVDTSRVYPELVLASATKDLVEKKLIYLYLSIYSRSNQQFARMAINTFLKDLSNPNPNVRALALRSLSNLRFKGRSEYALPAFNNGLNDFAPSVKRSAILGLTKLAVQQIRAGKQEARDEELLGKFYELLREEDTSVVCAALEAIDEVQQQGISMSRKLTFYLLSNLHRYNDLQFPVVVGYLELYDAKNDQEVMEILTALEPRLKSSNASNVLAISKVFIKLGKGRPELMARLLTVLRKSLLSFLNSEAPQVQYVILKHIEYLINTLKTDVFAGDFKHFYVGGNQKTYIKTTKIRILRLLSSQFNYSDVVNQLAECLFDQDTSQIAAKQLSSLIATSSQNDARFIAKTVVKTIETAPLPSICTNSLPLTAHFLRLYPKEFPLFAHVFYLLVENAKEEDSRCALLQIVGDFGQMIQQAPELLQLHGNLSDKQKISQLRATTKVFLKRPRQMKQFLGNLLKNTLSDDETHLHVKDYAAYIYRGLESGVEDFKSGFLEIRPHSQALQLQPQQFEFNTLQIIYGAKQDKWGLDPSKYYQEQQIPEQPGEVSQPPVSPKKPEVFIPHRFNKLEVQNFDVTFTMSSQVFQNCWQQYQVGSSITRMVNNLQDLSQQNLEELFKMWNITVLASAESEEEIKFYNFCKVQAQDGDLGIACIQCCFSKQADTMTLMIKSDDEELAGFVSRYIQQFLRLNQII